jgi:hypothetical protein
MDRKEQGMRHGCPVVGRSGDIESSQRPEHEDLKTAWTALALP